MRNLIHLLLLTFIVCNHLNAQQHTPMTFVGASSLSVMTTRIDNPIDTINFTMKGMTTGDITLPELKGMANIPSFTISDATFEMNENHVVSFPEQTFSTTITVDGAEKTITGQSLSGSYDMSDNSLRLNMVFQYGTMPFAVSYQIDAFYVKPVTQRINVVVGGQYAYSNESVTYKIRKYVDGEVEKLDVEVPSFTLEGTVIGDLSLGNYTVSALVFDEEKGGFYRDYAADGLIFHFTAKQGGKTTFDGDYPFNTTKENNILVTYRDKQPASIVNTFQMGSMPFGIVSTFGTAATAIKQVGEDAATHNTVYNLCGQRVHGKAKGIFLVNGKKVMRGR
ncbi:MAG: hypothetical protein KBT12_01930 [Bacteroidales bacterium]|nr:hypothetical protein [Candidatus Physcousia equi]